MYADDNQIYYTGADQPAVTMYADDLQIYHSGQDQAAVTLQLKKSANLATKWYDSNLLAGNLEKYQVMHLGFSQSSSTIYINGEEIRTTENLKVLGVTLDLKLNFSDHITSICKKASQRIGVLNLNLVLFKSAVLPYLM